MRITKHVIESCPNALGLDLIIKVYKDLLTYRIISEMTLISKQSLHIYGHYGRTLKRTQLADGTRLIGIDNIRAHIEKNLKEFGLNDEELSCLWLPIKDAAEKLDCIDDDVPKPAAYNITTAGKLNRNEDILIKHIGGKMLTEQTLRHWNLKDDPFNKYQSDIVEEFWSHDIYNSIIKQMVNVGNNGGFLAVVGPVGSGKTTCAEMAMVKLEESGVIVIQPQCKTGDYAKPNSMNAAIINKLSARFGFDEGGDKKLIPNQGEYSMAIVRTVLERLIEQGKRCVLFIEEAHLLPNNTMKHLKQLREMTLRIGRKVTQLISVIMIGQEELEIKLRDLYAVREVGIRIANLEIKTIPPVDAMPYLAHKFMLVGVDWYKICDKSLREELAFGDSLLILTPQRLNVIASALLEFGAKQNVDNLTLQLYWDMLRDKKVSTPQISVFQNKNKKRKERNETAVEAKKDNSQVA